MVVGYTSVQSCVHGDRGPPWFGRVSSQRSFAVPGSSRPGSERTEASCFTQRGREEPRDLPPGGKGRLGRPSVLGTEVRSPRYSFWSGRHALECVGWAGCVGAETGGLISPTSPTPTSPTSPQPTYNPTPNSTPNPTLNPTPNPTTTPLPTYLNPNPTYNPKPTPPHPQPTYNPNPNPTPNPSKPQPYPYPHVYPKHYEMVQGQIRRLLAHPELQSFRSDTGRRLGEKPQDLQSQVCSCSVGVGPSGYWGRGTTGEGHDCSGGGYETGSTTFSLQRK